MIPHRVELRPGPDDTTYTRSVYVTYGPGDDPKVRMVTARVTWDRSHRGSARRLIEQETQVFETRCTAQAGPRPCESYWYAAGDGPTGTIRMKGAIPGHPSVDLTVNLAGRTASVVTEQLTNAVATGTGPGAELKVGTGDPSTAGGERNSASADDAVSTALSTYDGPNPQNSGAGSVSVSGTDSSNTGSLGAQVTGGGSADTVAAAIAEGQNPPGGAGLIDDDKLGYGRGIASQGATVTSDLTVNGGGTNLGTATLVSASSTGATGTAIGDRDPGADLTTADDDVMTSSTTRSLGTIDLLGLPDLAGAPAGWAGHLIQLSGWTATTSSSAGPGITSPEAAAQTGTLSFYSGSGYSTVDLAIGTVSQALTVSQTVSTCRIDINGSLRGGGTQTSHQHEDGLETKPVLQSIATVAPPVLGNFTYVVTCNGAKVVDLAIDVDLGSTVAESRYAVPNA